MAKINNLQRGVKRKVRKTSWFVEGFPKNPYVALIETRRMIGEDQFQSLRKIISKCESCDIEFKYGMFEAEFSVYYGDKVRLKLTRNHKQMEQSSEYSFSASAFGASARRDKEDEDFFF